eukprot:NODE_3097_length_1425_cov_35.753456_g2690_i0.p1 GENE.NODE_3097_length_1425_cov_35.753456_g2690_i0~~NODE_3097_length_1425_cov_35.753456_g2690_i0.p1  ORF type:complete len:299 (+),score=40.47 NODE_3097_length_1425_cov_35.753456_g2690_i0:342-1238(+)
MVQELVNGGELFNVIQKQEKIQERHAADIIRQLLDIVIYMHDEKGVVHRDLKPENILVTSDDIETMKIKVVDFGFAKFFGHRRDRPENLYQYYTYRTESMLISRDVSVPITNSPKGSVSYMAPELLNQVMSYGNQPRKTSRPAIQKIDIYAVGVIAYVMLVGEYPFQGERPDEIVHNMKSGLPNLSDVSEDAENFCEWLMNSNPEKRPLAHEARDHPWLKIETTKNMTAELVRPFSFRQDPKKEDNKLIGGIIEHMRRKDSEDDIFGKDLSDEEIEDEETATVMDLTLPDLEIKKNKV